MIAPGARVLWTQIDNSPPATVIRESHRGIISRYFLIRFDGGFEVSVSEDCLVAA